jgi:hypothetical protein
VAHSSEVPGVVSIAEEYQTLKAAFDEQLASMAKELHDNFGGPGTYNIPGFTITVESESEVLVERVPIDKVRKMILDPLLEQRGLTDFLQIAASGFIVLQLG